MEEPASVMPPGSTALANISMARQMLAEARDLSGVLSIHNWVEQVKEAARIAGASRDALNEAAQLKLVAERMAGDLLEQMDMNRGGRPSETPNPTSGVSGSAPPPTLADLGITYRESSNWRAEATIPEDEFEEYVAQVKGEGRSLTTTGLVKFARARAAAEAEAAEAAAAPRRFRPLMDLLLPPQVVTVPVAPAAPSRDDLREIFGRWWRAVDGLCQVDPADIVEALGADVAELEEAAFERIALWHERFKEAQIDTSRA